MRAALDALGEVLRLGIRNLRGYPLRTLLTTLGVVFGVASVILMRAVGAGAEAEILREIGRLGIDNIVVNSVRPPDKKRANEGRNWVSRYGLKFKDAKGIQATVPNLSRVLPVHGKAVRVWDGSHKLEATLYGVTARHMPLLGLDVARGRPLSAVDGDTVARVCVVRPGLLRELGSFEDPLGRTLRLGDDLYTVVGVLPGERIAGYASKALAFDAKTAEIYVPFETILRREGTFSTHVKTGSFEATDVELTQIVVGVERAEDAIDAARSIRSLLEKSHDAKDYEIVVPLEYLRQRKRTQDVFNYAFLAIASISLLVGGIGIANIMLATVTERTKEIGIRRALGARKLDIVAQFLAETTLIATIGGVFGVSAGFALDLALRRLTGWTTIITGESVLVGLLVSMAVGILSGIFPARRAAELDPIAALRRE